MLDETSGELIRLALAEDLGDAGDVTTDAVIPEAATGRAALIAKQDCVLAGTEVFEAIFARVAPSVSVAWHAKDGDPVRDGQIVAHVEGSLRAIITGERTALNFIQRLSGVATLARRFVERASAPSVEIRDTRKTTPGMRMLEKAAVRAGGGTNHRMGLFQGIFLKDNHIAACGGIRRAIERARASRPSLEVQIECETLEQVREAVDAGADELLLDNMDIATLRESVRVVAGRARTEASGGVSLDTVSEIAAAGVDAVSAGALTHSAPSMDLSLELEGIDASRG